MKIIQRRIVGAVLKVPLDKRWHAYAWTLPEADFAFFDLRSSSEIPVVKVVRQPIAFRVAVHKSAWTEGRWVRVGKVDPSAEILSPVPTFIRDPVNGRFSINLAGEIRPATRRECARLECAAVWDPEHAEDRLRDHFAGRPNQWVQMLKAHAKS